MYANDEAVLSGSGVCVCGAPLSVAKVAVEEEEIVVGR